MFYITQRGITHKTQVCQGNSDHDLYSGNRITLFIVKSVAGMAIPSVNTQKLGPLNVMSSSVFRVSK